MLRESFMLNYISFLCHLKTEMKNTLFSTTDIYPYHKPTALIVLDCNLTDLVNGNYRFLKLQ